MLERMEPNFQSTQAAGKQDQKEDKARGSKVKAESTSIWVEPSRTVLRGDQETKCIYNIFNGKYSVLPVGEKHEGFITLEEKLAVEQNRGRYTQGLKVSIEGNIGSGRRSRLNQNYVKLYISQGKAATGPG